jgi:heme/copper-type cytochrome/quinol oxidase subunit 1
MPRRVANYPLLPHDVTTLNQISSIGSFILGASTLFFLYNVYKTSRHGERVTADDPWGRCCVVPSQDNLGVRSACSASQIVSARSSKAVRSRWRAGTWVAMS